VKLRGVALFVAGGLFGGIVGTLWQNSRNEGRMEEIVGNEIALLERIKGVPACEEVLAAGRVSGESHAGDVLVVWRHLAAEKRLQRLVVAPDLTTGYEEIDFDCPSR